MKKLLSLVLVLCMACMLIPAMADEDVTGEWFVKTMKQGDQEMDLSSLGMTMKFVLNADGTASVDMYGDITEATWTLDGSTITITSDDVPVSGTVADGVITLTQDGMEMVLVRELEAPAAVTATAAESEDAFLGDWELSAIDLMGVHLTSDMFATAGMDGFTVKLHIEPGKLTLIQKTSATAEENKVDVTTKFENGTLVLDSVGDYFPPIQLGDDGSLMFKMTYSSLELTCIMVPAAAAEAPAA